MVEVWEVKKLARQFLKQMKFDSSFGNLEQYARTKDVKIRFYNHKDLPGDIILQKMGLSDYAKQVRSFTYWGNRQKVIFIEDYASQESARRLLLHELGHLQLNHFDTTYNFVERDYDDDFLADCFAYYITHYERWRMRWRALGFKLVFAGLILFFYLLIVLEVLKPVTENSNIRSIIPYK